MAVGIDTTNPNALPPGLNPGYVFGYLDGKWQTYQALKEKYPTAVPVSITVFGSIRADCCDCENGDLTPFQAGAWAQGKVATGVVPLIYCSEAIWAEVKAQVGDIPCDYWIAAYPGPGPVLYPGSVAHQWIDRGTYDQSVVQDGWIPGRSTSPPIPVPTLPTKEQEMNAVVINGVPYVYAASPQGHLLQFVGQPNGWSVIDITDAILNANPGTSPYLVQP